MMRSTFIGGISKSFQDNWEAHTTRLHQMEPDAFDIFTWSEEVPDLEWGCGCHFATDKIQADWGSWAYKTTKAKLTEYNQCVAEQYRIPDRIIDRMEDGQTYAIIDADMIGYT